MLLKCTADGRPVKVNGTSGNHGHGARGMKMTMSTAPTMAARVHRKVMRAPHKRVHPGKTAHPGKMVHTGKMPHPGKMVHHPGKLAHLGKFGKLPHYAHTHLLRPPEPCENSNDSGLGPDAVNRLSDTLEEWEHPELKRRRGERESSIKLECDDANDAYAFRQSQAVETSPETAAPASSHSLSPDAPLSSLAPAPILPSPVMRAECSISSPAIAETQGKRYQDPYRSCGKLGNGGKLANKYPGGGKLVGSGGKLAGKLSGKYGGKLAQAMARRRALMAMTQSGRPGLAAPLSCRSRDGSVELQILCQPETQHRARYQTEGSRGAVKDNSGNGFPIVKLVGYDKPAVLQVFIGTDTGRVAPHMFYQACRVSGKNSTPCKERKEDGTVIIEIDLEPAKNWQVTCDCVGILKERNVDVEHRFGETLGGAGATTAGASHVSRGKKKSTRCRMVFRADIVNAAGHQETLQVCSTQIICTQPPGVPEVCRKSLVSCPASGGLELYLLGKNFLKETRVVFCQRQDGRTTWEAEVTPDKEFLQQTHLVCCVPPYACTDISEAVTVQLFVRSAGKASEPHAFSYTPPALDTGPQHSSRHHSQGGDEARPVLLWAGAMPPPAPPLPRRPSLILPDPRSPQPLKSEVADESSQQSMGEPEPCGEQSDGPLMGDELKGVDLRLKAEISRDSQASVGFASGYDTMKLSPATPTPSEPQSPLATFTQQLQAIQNQVQTDKMVESVTAAIFNTDDGAPQMYPPMMPMAQMAQMAPLAPMAPLDPMRRLMPEPSANMKALEPALMMGEGERRLMAYEGLPPPAADEAFNPFGAITKMEMEPHQLERRLARQTAHMEALVEDAMQATAAMLPDSAKLDELVNSRVEDHLSGSSPAAAGDELMLLQEAPMAAVKTPPAAVKSMILSAAAEILTSDSTMNALVTSAINTANILTTEPPCQPPAACEAQSEPLVAMSQAVSQAVTQAVSQAVSHAVSQAVSQEMTAPVQGLTDMSDQDLLSYINPSTFDQV